MKRNYYYPTIPTFSDFDRFFDIAVPSLGNFSRIFDQASQVSAPAADFYEDEGNYYVQAELPGIRKEDVNVELEDGVLVVTAKGESEKDDAKEAFSYRRSVTVPDGVQAGEISASHVDGILTITLPKAPEVKPQQISVN